MERVRALLAAATPGPWTWQSDDVDGCHVVEDPRARYEEETRLAETFRESTADIVLMAAAPDLAADLLDAHAALATERERAEAALADVAYWREQATAAAPCVDEIRRLTRRVVRGGTGCALDPTLAVDTAIATLDGMMVSIERIASVRDTARAAADALRAIVEGRAEAPTNAEVDAHFAAGGRWILRWSDGTFGHARGPCAVTDAREPGVVTAVRWWPLDATGRPCAWPTTGGGL